MFDIKQADLPCFRTLFSALKVSSLSLVTGLCQCTMMTELVMTLSWRWVTVPSSPRDARMGAMVTETVWRDNVIATLDTMETAAVKVSQNFCNNLK